MFAIVSIRARRRRDRRAQGRVTATSVGGEIASHLLFGHFGAIAKFLRVRVEPRNDAIQLKEAFVASRQKLQTHRDWQFSSPPFTVISCAKVFETRVSMRIFLYLCRMK